MEAATADWLNRRPRHCSGVNRRRRRRPPDGYIAPTSWYLTALEHIWPTLDEPFLYVASDELSNVLGDFAKYSPASVRDLGPGLEDLDCYADFYVLTQARALAISNSSFSFAAAMLNQGCTIHLRPDPDLQALIPYDPWASAVLLKPGFRSYLGKPR
jgi:hypothetical protein